MEREDRESGILWVRIRLPNGESDVYLGAVYLPPENSTTFSATMSGDGASCWDILQNQVSTFGQRGQVIVMGDFNARTSNKWDLPNMPDLDVPRNNPYPRRENSDQRSPNAWGWAMLALCKASNLAIVNGRTPGDPSGATTFDPCRRRRRGRRRGRGRGAGGKGLIDYFLVSHPLLLNQEGRVHHMVDMRVVPYGELPLWPLVRCRVRPATRNGVKFDQHPMIMGSKVNLL